MRNNYSRENVMKQIISAVALLLFYLAAAGTGDAQNKDSVQGDFEALLDLYNATQGQELEVLSNPDQLPSFENASYPYMYMINGEVWSIINDDDEWQNRGEPWLVKIGWENMTPETMGDAVGVEVDDNGRVIKLDLQKVTDLGKNDEGETIWTGNNVAGTLQPSIGNFKKLRFLNLKQNSFTGSIPAELGLLTKLERLSLGGQRGELDVDGKGDWYEPNHRVIKLPENFNKHGKGFEEGNAFYGPIPSELGDLVNLVLLEIRRQFLTGSLPHELGNLTKLKGLFLNGSKAPEQEAVGGAIPESYANMESIRYLNLAKYHGANGSLKYGGRGKFSGPFPKVIDQSWSNIINIMLVGNSFTGDIPEFINSREKRVAKFNGNNFNGGFPVAYVNGDNSGLSILDLSVNNLTGDLPESIPEATYPNDKGKYETLGAWRLNHNQFTGEIPEWVQNPENIQQFQITNNQFTDTFPEEVLRSPKLRTIFANDNNLFGELPNEEWVSHNVRAVVISGNNFEGEIPPLWKTIYTSALDKNGNYIGQFKRLLIENNELSGEIPEWLSFLPELWRVRIYGNKFTFSDILPHYDAIMEVINSNSGGYFEYAPQNPFGSELSRSMPNGETVIFDFSEFDYEGNEYQWTKNGNPISGANEPILTITNIAESDVGEYRLEVRNGALPELGTQSSEPIYFEIGENDGLNGDGSSTEDGEGSSDGSDDEGGSDGDDDGADSASGSEFPSSPIMYSPKDKVKNLTVSPKITWSSVEGADYYILHMSRSNPSGMVIDLAVEDTTYTHPEILGDNSVHYWRVKAVKDGEAGDWSSVREFTTTDENQPAMPDMVGPEHFTENVSVTPELEWQSLDADRYNIRIINKESSEVIISDETEGSSYTPTDPLDIETAYIWQVKSVKNGVEGAWSPQWEFTTGEYDYILAGPNLLSPSRNEENESFMPTFEWESVDADLYVITVSNKKPSAAKVLSGNEDDGTVIQEEVTETVYTSEVTLKPGTTYYWRVKGIKDSEEGEWSETWEFVTQKNNDSVSDSPGETPLATELKQNYPNPFNPTTQIEFILAELQNVKISVYNLMGREVATLVDGVLEAGRHTALFDASSLSSGVYIYRFISESQQITKKMTLIK